MTSQHTLFPKTLLASQSPRRRDLLRSLGLTFEQAPSGYDEDTFIWSGDTGSDVARMATYKAEAINASSKTLVIACDTTVELEGQILGKPSSFDEARQMLTRLSGKRHKVFSGVCVRYGGVCLSGYEATEVTMRSLLPHQIDDYLPAVSPLDKAGAYSIQPPGSLAVCSVQGCYFNVLGMPLQKLQDLLLKLPHPTPLDLFTQLPKVHPISLS